MAASFAVVPPRGTSPAPVASTAFLAVYAGYALAPLHAERALLGFWEAANRHRDGGRIILCHNSDVRPAPASSAPASP